ncbi:crossover junction endodeoxyribonuclease RuvC [Thalassiella azotivora]
MRVLGVDPGLTRCGLGVVDGRPGRTAAMVAVGVARSPAGQELGQRLLAIATALDAWLDEHRPDVVAVERVFSQSNVSTVMGTAQVSGVAVLAAARRGLPVALHTPSEVKAAVTGDGRAGKEQVATMVTRILRLPQAPTPADASDALALAVCHLWRGHGLQTAGAGRDARGAAAAGTAPTAAQRAWAQAAREARTRSARGFAVPDGAVAQPGAARGPGAARRPGSVRPPG